MTELIRRFLAHTFTSRTGRLELRCSPEERAAYGAAAALDDRDTSGWARHVLTREARKALVTK